MRTRRRGRKITDCGQDGCGKCDVCLYLAFIDEVQSVAPAGSVIQQDDEMEQYLKASAEASLLKPLAEGDDS